MTVNDEKVQSNNMAGEEGTLTVTTEAFVGRLFEAGLGAFDLLTVYIGDRLGLYPCSPRSGR